MKSAFRGMAAQIVLTAGVSNANSMHGKQWHEHNKALAEMEKEVIDPKTFFNTSLQPEPPAPVFIPGNAGPYLNYHLPRVLNKHTATAPERQNSVYIGRGSKWGNDNPISAKDNRAKVILMFKKDLCKLLSNRFGEADRDAIMVWVHALRGKSLVCYCAPYPCHGDIILAFVNSADPVRFIQTLIDEMRNVDVG